MNLTFNYNSRAARRARQAKFVAKYKLVMTTLLVSVLLFAIGLSAIVAEQNLVGSLLFAAGVQVLLMSLWLEWGVLVETAQLKSDGDDIVLQDVLSQDILSHLKKAENSQDLWQALGQSSGYAFVARHFQFDHKVLDTALSETSISATAVVASAVELARRHGHNRLGAGSLLVGLIQQRPNPKQFLAQFSISPTELEDAIDWLHHRDLAIELQAQKEHTPGGVARDWTSGYTPQLNKIALDLTAIAEHAGQVHRLKNTHQSTVSEMINMLSNGGGNVVLVGANGIGKTTTVQAFAQTLIMDANVPAKLRFNRVYEMNASQLLADSNGQKLEDIMLRLAVEAQRAKNIILFFDDAEAFFAEGSGQVDIGRILQPILEHASVRTLFALTPEAWQSLEQGQSAIAARLHALKMTVPDESQSLRLLEDQALYLEAEFGKLVTYQAIREAYRLAERYERDLVEPGAALKLLRDAFAHDEAGLVTQHSVQLTIEALQGVKVAASDDEDANVLLHLEDAIHERMVNQSRAVKVVADALRRSRSGIANPNKPQGAFLFLGPTGVGKTELAKALAQVYFNSENSMVRLDMNEFTTAADTHRLLDSQATSGLLAHVQRQPFSVVLLDEIEKAHPDIVNVFLQVLEEGEMPDSSNKPVSFKDAIIIATSNAGADTIRRYIEEGKQLQDFEKEFIDQLINGNIFKPEFINRFDETVVFRPLTDDELLQVVDIMMKDINANLAKQQLNVALDDAAKHWLVANGNDSRLGARPLRRMIQRTVENIVAQKVLEKAAKAGDTITLTADDLKNVT